MATPHQMTARTRLNKDTSLWHEGQRVTVLLTGQDTKGKSALVEISAKRGYTTHRRLHHREDETLYVLDGVLTVYSGGKVITAGRDTAVFLPRGVEHAYTVESEEARVLTALMPAGFEGFYQDLSGAQSSGTTSVERLVTAAAKYGCEITGPAPSRK